MDETGESGPLRRAFDTAHPHQHDSLVLTDFNTEDHCEEMLTAQKARIDYSIRRWSGLS